MENINQIEFMQHVYSVAAKYLYIIGSHPNHVEMGHIGYFMDIKNIQETVSLDPKDWYKDDVYKDQKTNFDDLPTEDQWQIKELMDDILVTSMSQNHLIEKCHKCLALSLKYSDKILDLFHDKNKIKKSAA